MMGRYHVSPVSGEPGLCKAKVRCPFGDLASDHYDSKDEARSAFEKAQVAVPTPAKAPKAYEWPARSEKRVFKSKSGDVTVRISDPINSMGVKHKLEAWLTVPGRGNVAFISLLARGDNYYEAVGEHLAMCSIETRVDSRKQGFSQELRTAMEQEVGQPIYSSGSYTPEGWDAFGKHGGLYAEEQIRGFGDEPGVKYRSQGFVASWKDQLPVEADSAIDYDDEQYDAMYELDTKGVFQKLRNREIIWVEE